MGKGEASIEGLTDTVKPRRLGPKRASKIRSLFNLTKEDNVCQYVIKRQIVKDGKKPYFKSPKIQRLVTPQRLRHKRALKAERKERYTKARAEAEAYNNMLVEHYKAAREKRNARLQKRRSESRKISAEAT